MAESLMRRMTSPSRMPAFAAGESGTRPVTLTPGPGNAKSGTVPSDALRLAEAAWRRGRSTRSQGRRRPDCVRQRFRPLGQVRDAFPHEGRDLGKAGHVDLVGRVGRAMVVGVSRREDLHGRHVLLGEAHLVRRLDRLGHAAALDTRHERGAAEDVLPLGSRARSKGGDFLRPEAADGVQVDHALHVRKRAHRMRHVVLRPKAAGLFSGECDEHARTAMAARRPRGRGASSSSTATPLALSSAPGCTLPSSPAWTSGHPVPGDRGARRARRSGP